MAPKTDTRKKLRETMDELALALAEHAKKLPAQKMDDKLATFATLTKYQMAINREPEQPEGGDLGQFRDRLDRFSARRGGSARGADDGDGDTDDFDESADDREKSAEYDAADDPDEGDGGGPEQAGVGDSEGGSADPSRRAA